MSPPKFEAKFDSHTARKIPCFSGAKGEEDLVKVFELGTGASGDCAIGDAAQRKASALELSGCWWSEPCLSGQAAGWV